MESVQKQDIWRVKKLRTLYSNKCVSKMATNFDLQDETKLAYEVKKYKYIYNKAYNQHLFPFLQKLSFPQTKLSVV